MEDDSSTIALDDENDEQSSIRYVTFSIKNKYRIQIIDNRFIF